MSNSKAAMLFAEMDRIRRTNDERRKKKFSCSSFLFFLCVSSLRFYAFFLRYISHYILLRYFFQLLFFSYFLALLLLHLSAICVHYTLYFSFYFLSRSSNERRCYSLYWTAQFISYSPITQQFTDKFSIFLFCKTASNGNTLQSNFFFTLFAMNEEKKSFSIIFVLFSSRCCDRHRLHVSV